MTKVYSLRARLIAIILIPLIVVTSLVGLWQLRNAQATAKDVFNRGLLTVALAVANDVAVSEGDALSPETSQLLENSSGGPVFYHVYAPDGVIVAGYATPPVGIPSEDSTLAKPLTFDAIYQGRLVSGVRLQTLTQIEGFAGIFTTTVWQDRSVRDSFVFDLVLRTLIGLAAVIASLAVIVWFGVRYGLRPLTDLEDAIEQRSSDDLSPIRRAVPEEVVGVVQTLNGLFRQVGGTLDAQSQFIANAAHQLRNPIAGVLSLAEAVHGAKSHEDMRTRSSDLLDAARNTSELTQRLLLHERARAISPKESFKPISLAAFMQSCAQDFATQMPANVKFVAKFDLADERLLGDELMLKEALSNLVNNARVHGGTKISEIELGACIERGEFKVWVQDDGIGIPSDEINTALTRFAQVGAGDGSGLGLSITQAIVEGHSGTLELISLEKGVRAEISIGLKKPREGS